MLLSAIVFLLSSVFYTLQTSGETCDTGLYGPNCNLKCSLGCKNKKCELTIEGTALCTEGCEPGWYGSQCKIPCQLPENVCRKCPSKCEDGFCRLGSSCVSGCVDSYYGTDCFTCEPDCQVCSKHTGRCYSCTDGCPFSTCFKESTCHLVKDYKATYGSVFGILLILLGLLAAFFVYRHKHNISSRSVACLGWFRKRVSRASNPDVSMSRDSGLNHIGMYRAPSYAVIRKTVEKTTGDGYDVMTQTGQRNLIQDVYEDIEDPEDDCGDTDDAYDRLKHDP